MKSIVRILLFIFLAVYSLSFTVQAEEVANFTLNDVASKNSRIFTVTVNGNGSEKIAVGTFVLEYNPEIIEFREVHKIQDNTTVKTKEDYGKLTVIFLNEQGVDLSSAAELFTVDFKAENLTDSTQITLNASDCVNADEKEFASNGGSATVSLLSAEATENSSNKTSSKTTSSQTTNSKATSNSTANKTQKSEEAQASEINKDSTEETTSQDKIFKVSEKDNNLSVLITGAVMMLVIVTTFATTYFIGKNSNNGKK